MLKRWFDIIFSGLLLLFCSPLLLCLALLIRYKMGSPVLFLHERPGLNGLPFKMIKFRTMTDFRDVHGSLLSDEKRLTRFGQFLRSSSLDELPELWNVLMGDMSLVGPRPLMIEYLPLYTPEQHRRHEVCPGITGWAQINGRNSLSWEDKFKLDLWYVNHHSFWLDIKILCLTIKKVLIREGISAENHVTTYAFKGNDDPKSL